MQEKRCLFNQRAFSLIEVMVAMAIFSIIMAAVITAFQAQLKLNSTQQCVSAMQQNARAAMYFMAKELMMAGFDPTGKAGTGIQPVADRHDAVTLSMDVTGGESDGVDNDGDGETDSLLEAQFGDGKTDGSNEVITYALNNGQLTRASQGGSPQALADNIDVLDFEYFGLDPLDPACIDDCHLDLDQATAAPGAIRIVQVSIIARSGSKNGAPRYPLLDDAVYRNQLGKIILDKQTEPDSVRRLLLSAEINLRNQGLK